MQLYEAEEGGEGEFSVSNHEFGCIYNMLNRKREHSIYVHVFWLPCIPVGPNSCRVRKIAWSWYSASPVSCFCCRKAQRHTFSRLWDGFPSSIRLMDWRKRDVNTHSERERRGCKDDLKGQETNDVLVQQHPIKPCRGQCHNVRCCQQSCKLLRCTTHAHAHTQSTLMLGQSWWL